MSSMSSNHNTVYIIFKFTELKQDFVSTFCYIRIFLLKNISLSIPSNVFNIYIYFKKCTFIFCIRNALFILSEVLDGDYMWETLN